MNLEKLEQYLKSFESVLDKNKVLLKSVIIDLVNEENEEFIEFLFQNEEIQKEFFKEIKGAVLFRARHFKAYLLEKNFLSDSYTEYKNKIGLSIDNSFLEDIAHKNIVINFPFKDCILEGGMSREEKSRKEVYLNEILASEDIHVLKEPKVITNVLRVEVENFIGNTDDVPSCQLAIIKSKTKEFRKNDNLLIKGNNLMALYSLLPKFRGKVKLIYIDPPYNTRNDRFAYNDNFNHSTWLVFMKNRLEVAKQLLREDGAIFVSIDDNEQAYLKVLMDEIFGRDNFIHNIVWEKKYSPANDSRWISATHDIIILYSKEKHCLKLNLLERTDKMNARYLNYDDDPRGEWKPGGFSVKTYTKSYDYPIETPSGKIVYPPKGSCWQTSKDRYIELLKDNRIYFGKKKESKPQIKQFLSEVKQGVVPKTIWLHNEVGHNQVSKVEIQNLFQDKVFSTPKPEALLKRIIEISTSPGDIVLDFFAGSGTTGAVAHKMDRRWILVEQMDYVKKITKVRLEKVLEGEQGGISKDLEYKGGGSFVYLELKAYNEVYRDKLLNVNTKEEIIRVVEEMKSNALLSWRRQFDKLDKIECLENPEYFKKVIIEEILDKNMYYVPVAEMEDATYNVSEEDKAITREFYGQKY
ncbi:site-specific DNA-methyltransferase [Borrelia sp. P9F1]|uniref:site-specific DNA-methyltransferase n=1 Tax=Borrelia sp. P9F1 TaxID=3058374 RepID=UPI0026473454|nr:site-specific DNA-methyltransferase [Borrelia sp. P9F1]WKC58550.1 site-specific DNA-methyltransferase [Borrelia sp. P9F1]WKC58639.1 site-specific DNA-methyltransferase [Borrelia sp. P9F1]